MRLVRRSHRVVGLRRRQLLALALGLAVHPYQALSLFPPAIFLVQGRAACPRPPLLGLVLVVPRRLRRIQAVRPVCRRRHHHHHQRPRLDVNTSAMERMVEGFTSGLLFDYIFFLDCA